MKIPIIEADYPLKVVPVPVIPTEGKEGIWKAVGGVAEEGQNLINTIVKQDGEVRSKLKEADDLLTIGRVKSDFVLFGQDLDKQLDSDPDQINRLPKFMEGAKKKKEEILSTIPDKILNKRIEFELDRNTLAMSIQQKDKGYKRKSEQLIGEAEGQVIEAANKGDIEGVKKITQKLVDLGIKDESWKVTQDNRAEETAEKSNISLRINSQDIPIVKSLIEDLDKGKYKTINPLERANYRAIAERNIKSIDKENETKEDELAVDNAYYKLKKDWGSAYDVMYKFLANPEWQKENKLDTKRKAQVEVRLKNEETLMEAGIKKIQDDNSNKNLILLNQQKLTIPMINEQLRKKEISESDGRYYSKAIEQDAEKDPKTDWAIYTEIKEDIIKELPYDQIKNKILKNLGSLARNDREKLSDQSLAKLDREENEGKKRAYEFLKSQIIPTRGITAKIVQTPKEAEDYANSLVTLDNAIDNAKKAGKPLSGTQILEKAKEIAPLFQKPMAQRAYDMMELMKEEGKGMKEMSAIRKKAEKYKTKEEVKKDFESKKLTPEEAELILKYKFKMP